MANDIITAIDTAVASSTATVGQGFTAFLPDLFVLLAALTLAGIAYRLWRKVAGRKIA